MPSRSRSIRPVVSDDEHRTFLSDKPGKCRNCGRRRALSYDSLCLSCCAAERDGYKMDSEAGGELLHEAYCALSGVAGELLRPCAKPCGGHLRPDADALYKLGLERYGRLYEAAHLAAPVAAS